MNLNMLPKITERSKKKVGRGIGSGKGKTSGRGQKGQKARGKTPLAQVGAGLILYKKLPYRRGLGNRKVSQKPILLKLSVLGNFKTKEVVDMDSLIKKGIVLEKDVKKRGIKILGGGELKAALTVAVPVSKKAQEMIEKAGGKLA